MWKIVKMPIADWLPYPSPLYINIGFVLSYCNQIFIKWSGRRNDKEFWWSGSDWFMVFSTCMLLPVMLCHQKSWKVMKVMKIGFAWTRVELKSSCLNWNCSEDTVITRFDIRIKDGRLPNVKPRKHKIDEGIFKSVYFSDFDLSTQVQPINYYI